MAQVNNNGVMIHYEVEGDGPPLTLMHGMGGSIQNWRRAGYIDALKDQYHLVLVDSRGFGQSDKPHEVSAYTRHAKVSDVTAVLDDLGLNDNGSRPIFEALNKIDLLDEAERAIQLNQTERRNDAVVISALTGEGCPALLAVLDASLNSARRVVVIAVDVTDGAAIAWLYRHGEVLSRSDDEQKAHIQVSLDAADLARFERRTNA